VIKKVTQAYLTNALFVVRKSGQKRVREEGRKNVHAFVNGIIQPKLDDAMPQHEVCRVRYDPYTMDYFHYERIVNGKPKWLPVSQCWIGKVYLNIVNGKPIIHADIDNMSSVLNLSKLPKTSLVDATFLRRKRKIIDNKNKIIDKTVAI
jgi:hypothetical protein